MKHLLKSILFLVLVFSQPGFAQNRQPLQTYQIPCNRGGFDHNKNIDLIPPEAMVSPSRNLNLHEGGRGKRGGTAQVNDPAVSSTPEITGLFDYILRDGSQFLLMATDDGNYWSDYSGIGVYSIPGSADSIDSHPFIYPPVVPTTTSTTTTTATITTTTTSTTETTLPDSSLLLIFGIIGSAVVIFVIVVMRFRRN